MDEINEKVYAGRTRQKRRHLVYNGEGLKLAIA
jgi:hypothetical protein